MFSRVTMGFGAAVAVVSALAAASGATTTGTATIPAILGGLFILLGWLSRIAPNRPVRQWSPSRFPIILAAALLFSSARGLALMFDAVGTGATPTGTGIFLFVMVIAGAGYIVYGAWTDIAEARRAARARALASAAAPRQRRSGH